MKQESDYSLAQLEDWVSDAMDSGATPQEIYGTILDVVLKNLKYHKACLSQAKDLYEMLVGNDELPENYDEFENPNHKQDNVISIETFLNDGSDRSRREFDKFWNDSDFELNSPDLIQSTYTVPETEITGNVDINTIDEIDRITGEVAFPKTLDSYHAMEQDPHTASLSYQEMIDKGYEMTGDGFWVPKEKEDKDLVPEDGC